MKHTPTLTRLIGLGLLLAGAPLQTAFAEITEVSTTKISSPRETNRLGAFLALGNPNPGLLGLNVGYNLNDFLRAEAGYANVSTSILGQEASVTTYGAGMKAMMPGWSLSPALGIHYGTVSYTGTGLTVGGFTKSGSHIYTSLGIDYQAQSGFLAGLGYNLSLASGVGGSAFLNLGWFFDFI